jgi:anti-sigma B factor antagonist
MDALDTAEEGRGALLEIDVSTAAGGEAVVTLSGELDLSNVDVLQSRLDPLLATHPAVLTFDLANLRFLDSSGIGVLVAASSHVGAVTLRQPSEIVRQIIRYTGLSEVLPIEP